MENDIKKLLDEQKKDITEEVKGQISGLRGEIKGFKEEIKSHFGVVAESLEGKIALVAEQHTSIMKVLGQHTEDIGTIKEEIAGMNVKLSHIENQLL